MDFSGALDVVVGLLFMFFVFGVVASGIYEAGARLFASRSRLLWSSLRHLLDGDSARGDRRPQVGNDSMASLTDSLYAHPLVRQLEGRTTDLFKKTRLSRIPSTVFGQALVDIVIPAGANATSVDQLRTAIKASATLPEEIKRSLLPIASDATATLDRVRLDIGEWFDTRMVTASRVYRRNTRWIMIAIALAVVISFNVDAIRVAQDLYQDDATRGALAQQAAAIVTACTEGAGDSQNAAAVDQELVSDCARQEIDKIEGGMTLPVGWTDAGQDGFDGLTLLGWVLAVVAIAQGAPFWFDLLRRISGVRS
jgi:hypothetical protein